MHPQNGADSEVVIANSHRSTSPTSLEQPLQNRSLSPEDVADETLDPPDADGVVLVEDSNGDISESEAIAPRAALTPRVKGKKTLYKAKLARSVHAPGELNRVHERGRVARRVLNVSKVQILGQVFTPLLGPILLDIGSNTPRHQQAFPPRRRGTNEQGGSP